MLLKQTEAFRESGQSIDVRSPGRDALAVIGLLGASKAHNITEQA